MNNYITTEELVDIFQVIDDYFIKAYNIDIVTFMEKLKQSNYDFVSNFEFLLFNEPGNSPLRNLYDKMHKKINLLKIDDAYQFILDALHEMFNKGLVRIDKEIIEMSGVANRGIVQNKNKHTIDLSTSVTEQNSDIIKIIKSELSEDDIKNLIETLKKNIEKYENLYKNKIWLIESIPVLESQKLILPPDFRRKEKICITPERFFHLMGLDYKTIDICDIGQRNPRQFRVNYNELLSIVNRNIVDDLLDKYNREIQSKVWSPIKGEALLDLLKYMLNNEEKFMEYLCEGKLSNIISIPKLYMKSYSFERLGFIEHSNGMVMFDRRTALKNGVDLSKSHLSNGIALLKDFILRNKLDFIISLYNKKSGKDSMQIPRDQQTIFISRNGGFDSDIFTGQLSSISEKVSAYRANDFLYTIQTASPSPSESGEPIEIIEFSFEDKQRMAQLMVSLFPQMNNELLREYIKNYQEFRGSIKRRK